jgi:hypothetical protein
VMACNAWRRRPTGDKLATPYAASLFALKTSA